MMLKSCDLLFLFSRQKRWALSAKFPIAYVRGSKLTVTFQDPDSIPEHERGGASRGDQAE